MDLEKILAGQASNFKLDHGPVFIAVPYIQL